MKTTNPSFDDVSFFYDGTSFNKTSHLIYRTLSFFIINRMIWVDKNFTDTTPFGTGTVKPKMTNVTRF